MTTPRSIRPSLIAQSGDITAHFDQVLDDARTKMRSDPIVKLPWQEHLDAVYRYATRLTRDSQQAYDLTQETMLRGWRKRAALRDPKVTRVWLLRIATNLWTDSLRSKAPKPQLLRETTSSRDATIPQRLIQQEQVALALAALDALPPRQRQVLHLITLEQMSHEEVSKVLQISRASVKSNLAAGRQIMRERLRDVYEDVCGVKRE